MPVPRRLLPLLATALLAVAPVPALAQGGAGDDQYQDPFGGSSSGGGSGGSKQQGGSGGGGAPHLTNRPQANLSSTPAGTTESAASSSSSSGAVSNASGTGSTAATASAGTAPVARQQLPRTGLDAPVIALLGVGLLAAGLGLRLRTAHAARRG